MKYTKDEEARAERSSVKMWPGITAGIIRHAGPGHPVRTAGIGSRTG